MSGKITATLALALFLLLTNRWIDYDDLPQVMDTPDVHDYMSIAFAAPRLPDKPMLFHRAQRIAVPFLLGVVALATSVPHKLIFLFATLLCCGVILFFMDRILSRLGLNANSYVLCIALLMLNPYVFRLYLTLPGMVGDLFFVLGVAVCLAGFLRGTFAVVLTGVILAALARQTVLLLLPGLLLWLYFGEQWKHRPLKMKLLYAITIVLSASLIYEITAIIAARFAYVNMNVIFVTAMLKWIQRSFSIAMFAEFLMRVAMPHIFLLLISAATFLALRKRTILRAEFWLCLLLSVSCIAQPLFAGPAASTGGVVRLSSFGFLPLLAAAAMIFADNRVFVQVQLAQYALLLILIAAASLHHVFSAPGAAFLNAQTFAVFYFSLALTAGFICFSVIRRNVNKTLR